MWIFLSFIFCHGIVSFSSTYECVPLVSLTSSLSLQISTLNTVIDNLFDKRNNEHRNCCFSSQNFYVPFCQTYINLTVKILYVLHFQKYGHLLSCNSPPKWPRKLIKVLMFCRYLLERKVYILKKKNSF